MKAGAHVLQLSEQDVALSFLPLSHSFERTVSYIYLLSGVAMVFAESLDTIARDIAQVRPTLFTGVPRMFEKLHGRIMEKGQAEAGLERLDLQLGGRRWRRQGRRDAARTVGRTSRLAAGVACRPPGLRQNPGGPRRSRPLHGFRERTPADQHRGVLSRDRCADCRRLWLDRNLADPDRQPAGCASRRHRRPRHSRRRAPYRRGRRDPRARSEYHVGLLQQAGGDGRGAQGWLVPHRRHRRDRRGRVPANHGPQEGPARDVGRQEDRAAADRGRHQKESARRRSGAPRRSPQFRRPRSSCRISRCSSDGSRTWAVRPRRARSSSPAPTCSRSTRRSSTALNRDLSQFERIKKIALLPAEFSIESGELTPTLKLKRKVVAERWSDAIEALYNSEC